MTDALKNLLPVRTHFRLSPDGKHLRIITHDSIRFGILAAFAVSVFGLLLGLAGHFGYLGLEGMVDLTRMGLAAKIAGVSFALLWIYESYFEIDLSDPVQGRIEWVQGLGGKFIRMFKHTRGQLQAVTCVEIQHRGQKNHWEEYQVVLLTNTDERLVVIHGAETMNKPRRYQAIAILLAEVLGLPYVVSEPQPAKVFF